MIGSAPSRSRPRRSLRPTATELEPRALLAASPVADTTRFPFSAVVSIDADFRLADGTIQNRLATGVLVDTFHVLTNAHNIEFPGLGRPVRLRVYAGRNGASFRPFGEAMVTNVAINESQYQNGAGAGGDWDLAVLTLDRNVGQPSLAGWLSFGWTSDSLITQIAQQRITLQEIGYPGRLPGDPNADGFRQYATGGPILVGLGLDPNRFWFAPNTATTFQGNSGSPVIDNSPEWRVPTIIGIHVGQQDVLNNGQPLPAVIRITQEKWDWLIPAMGRTLANPFTQAKGPIDRPDLMDADRWFNTSNSDYQRRGSRINVSSVIFNGGTARAGMFRVSYYLSRDPRITTADIPLGSQTVNALAAARSTTVRWSGRLPTKLAAGNYYVGWIIDSTRRVRSYSRVPNAPFRDPSSTGYVRRYALSIASKPLTRLTLRHPRSGPAAMTH